MTKGGVSSEPLSLDSQKGQCERHANGCSMQWRRIESQANPSPRQIPVNREIYREFHHFGGENTRSNRPIKLN